MGEVEILRLQTCGGLRPLAATLARVIMTYSKFQLASHQPALEISHSELVDSCDPSPLCSPIRIPSVTALSKTTKTFEK